MSTELILLENPLEYSSIQRASDSQVATVGTTHHHIPYAKTRISLSV